MPLASSTVLIGTQVLNYDQISVLYTIFSILRLSLLNKIISIIVSCLISFAVQAESTTVDSEGMKLRLEQVAADLGIPWGMSFISTKNLLVTDRSGAIRRVDIDTGQITPLKNVPEVLADGQGGMLDVAISPRFDADGWIYFTYVKSIDGLGATVLARAKLNADTFSNWQQLLVTNSVTTTTYHFGSRIAFDDKGHVYFSVGDRGERDNAQDLSNHAGSIMRLNLDGSVPEDNPYQQNKKLLPEVWSYGHRNPQGLAYDAISGRLWSIEHGPRGGDEINLIHPGANYGWPKISYGKEYWGPMAVGEGTHAPGMEQPVKVYTPSIAPGSLLIYNGKALPGWTGNLLSGALKLQHINRIVLSEEGEVIKEERLLESLGERIRALTQSSQGWLYFTTDSGKLYRLRPDE
jgi:glucose/arabinose dehydrogenase